MTPGRDANGRFVKGHTGNPNGRPKRDVEAEYLDAVIAVCPLGRWRKIVAKAVDQAEHGNHVARKWLSDFLAPVPQRHEHTGQDGGPLAFRWMTDDDEEL